MKLQPASQREVARMAVGCGICAVAEILGLFLLSQFGIGTFGFPMILGALGGSIVAIANFTLMCLMVQGAAGTKDEKLLRAKVQASYNLRLFFQAGWVVAAFLIPQVNVVAAAIPLLFPTVVIYYLQITGRLMPKDDPPRQTTPVEEPENPEDNLNSFEV